MGNSRPLLLEGFKVDPALAGERLSSLPFLSKGAVEVKFQAPLTFLVGENGSTLR